MTVKVLVVDDEPDLEMLLRQKFRRQIREGQYEFLFAQDGLDALTKVRANSDIDIIMTDINMPRMDGLTLLSKLKEEEVLAKSVIVSAYGDMSNIRTAMNRGAFDFVTKPIDFNDLEITLSKTWEQIRVLKQAAREHEQLQAIRNELTIASNIQQMMLPNTFPPFPHRQEIDIHARMTPAKEVSGDFYDFFLVDDKRLAFLIGDVSGKGVPASLFMAICRTLLRAATMTQLSSQDTLAYVNRTLCAENPASMFVTCAYAQLDLSTGRMDLALAGHDAPMILRTDGSVYTPRMPQNIALGVVDDFEYKSQVIELAPGEMVLLYTDGVTESENLMGGMFRQENLEAALKDCAGKSSAQVVQAVFEAVATFSNGTEQADDITALAVRISG